MIYIFAVAPHTRCVDWNIDFLGADDSQYVSHLTRGAWIEIHEIDNKYKLLDVAPHTRCVDWNLPLLRMTASFLVAPHTRCVDWNCKSLPPVCGVLHVAPHTRCVDWNIINPGFILRRLCRTSHEVRGLKCCRWTVTCVCCWSHLTRGAWIEISLISSV